MQAKCKPQLNSSIGTPVFYSLVIFVINFFAGELQGLSLIFQIIEYTILIIVIRDIIRYAD
jgi:hypothetical protein